MTNYRHLAVLIATAMPVAAAAQGDDTIVVTGQGLRPAPDARVLGVVSIDRDRIAEGARLETLLADVAGLQQFRRADSRSASPTAQGITLRGIGGTAASRALLILDGVPQADPFGGWVAFPAYAGDRIGRVTVTRGGGSGYYGPGALVGIVELESRRGDDLAPFAGRIAYGSRQSVEAQGTAALVRDGGFATLSGAYARGDGFVPIVAESRGPVDRASPYAQVAAAARAAIRIAPATELQANVSTFADDRERGTPLSDTSSRGADASIRLVGRGQWGWSALAYVQSRTSAASFVSVDAARTSATRTLDQYNTPATGAGARIEVIPPLGAGTELRLGADARLVSGQTQERFTFVAGAPTRLREAGGRALTIGGFADGSVTTGALTATLGARVDRWELTDGRLVETAIATGATLTNTRFPRRADTEVTGRLGLAYQLAPALSVRGAAYRGWRLPTLNELYRPFRVGADATASNAALAPERLTGWEAGATVTPAPGVRVNATWFDNRLDNAVANVTVTRGPGVFPGVGFVSAAGFYRIKQNLDAVRARGIEVDATLTRGPFHARGSWSHTIARVRASGNAAVLDGLTPAQTPRDLVAASLGWRKGGLAVSGTLRHAARQFEDDLNARTLAPATTLDAYAALPIGRGVRLEARAENISDARVETGISGAGVIERAAPRTLWIGLKIG